MAVTKKDVGVPAKIETPKTPKIVNIVINGQLRYKMAEVLEESDRGLMIRSDPNGLSRCEITLVPWGCIEAVGYFGER